jgi:uncharacterized protein YjiK
MRYFYSLLLIVPVLSFMFMTMLVPSVENNNIDLSEYEIVRSHSIEDVADNLSGITYSPDSKSLFAIINGPEKIVELSKSGRIVREIAMQNFHDTEGIAYIGGDEYAIIQERSRIISIVTIRPETVAVDAREFRKFNINPAKDPKSGLEGVAWSVKKGLYLANESVPMEIINFSRVMFDQVLSTDGDGMQPSYFRDFPISDISGLHFSEAEQLLFVLSDESKRLLAVNTLGKVVSTFNFYSLPFALDRKIVTPEGITIDSDNNIYVVGEPNVFMVLSPKVVTKTNVRQRQENISSEEKIALNAFPS